MAYKEFADKKKASAAGKKSSNKGQKQRRTIVKEKLGVNNIEDLKDDVLRVWTELLQSTNEDNRKFASKEISKYVFSTKKETNIDLNAKGNINIFTVKPDTTDE